jgi:hypothetical protein
MEVLTFAGRYEDQLGPETIVWRVEGSRRYALPSLDFFTAIRGVGVWGTDFDSLEPVDTSAVAGRKGYREAWWPGRSCAGVGSG